MAKIIFIPLDEAVRRYGKQERTLKEWARNGELLYQVINPESRQSTWLIESPEARYERLGRNVSL